MWAVVVCSPRWPVPSTAGADIGGLGSALAGDVGPAASGNRRSRRNGRRAGAGLGRRGFVDRRHVGAAQLGRRSRRNPGGEHARHAGVAELGRPAGHRRDAGTNGIAGMPAVANGGRGGSSFGAPRYGVKPKVMPAIPKPTLT